MVPKSFTLMVAFTASAADVSDTAAAVSSLPETMSLGDDSFGFASGAHPSKTAAIKTAIKNIIIRFIYCTLLLSLVSCT
jgi:hypothetical protein